jgi:hypothetical protein
MKIAIITRSNKRRFNKDYGCCVAGITEHGDWIRLVADEFGDSLPDNNMTPKANTVIEADVLPAPLAFQPENAVLGNWYTINESISQYIELIGLSSENYIFGNTSNRLNKVEMESINGSLRLFKVSNLEIYRGTNNSWKVKFNYNRNDYDDIAMTDPKHYRVGFIGDAHVVVSLPNDDGGFSGYYKFVATIII